MSEYTREALLARAETAEARIKVLEAALYPLVVGCLEADAREDAPEFVNGEAERGRDSLPKCGRCGGCGALDGVEYVDTAIPEAVLCPDCGGWGFLKHALEHAAAPQEPTDLAAANAAILRLQKRCDRMAEALEACETYFDNRADADAVGDPPRFQGNTEMNLLGVVRRALGKE